MCLVRARGAPLRAWRRKRTSWIRFAFRRDPGLDDAAATEVPDRRPAVEAMRNVCPGELELKNMETSANALSLGKKEKAFLLDEIRRARQCAKGQGSYTASDWKISREARDDQRRLRGGEIARVRAENMHSAADPVEGDRIQATRNAERIAEAHRHRPPGSAVGAGAPATLSSCDRGGCWGADGTRYTASGSGTVFGPRGACRVVGRTVQCP